MKRPRHHVTDHALIRWLERHNGLDVEALRCALGRRIDEAVDKVGLGDEVDATGVRIEGMHFRIIGRDVVTVVLANRPDPRRGRPKGARHDD